MLSTLDKKYLQDAGGLSLPPGIVSGRVAWECPANIALVKYWGKKPMQLPLNPSISFTLRDAKTILITDFSIDHSRKQLSIDYYFEDQSNKAFEEKFYQYLQHVSRYLPFINRMQAEIRACNTFPHSAGIASSASSFGALALSLCSIEQQLAGTLGDETEFKMKASFLARLGSGSACRSVTGGYSMWGRTDAVELSGDEAAISLNSEIHPAFQDYCDSILVIHSGVKSISSSAGHRLMEHHPFKTARTAQAIENLEKMLAILKSGDESGFAEVVEEEALTLHAMMLTSRPGYLLFTPATLEAISRIRKFRESSRYPVCFTLDAGANVHLLYPAGIRDKIMPFIITDLSPFCEQGRILHDTVGKGPVKLN